MTCECKYTSVGKLRNKCDCCKTAEYEKKLANRQLLVQLKQQRETEKQAKKLYSFKDWNLRRYSFASTFMMRINFNRELYYSDNYNQKTYTLENFVFRMVKESHSDTMRYGISHPLKLISKELFDQVGRYHTGKDDHGRTIGVADHINGMVSNIDALAMAILNGKVCSVKEVLEFMDFFNATILVSKKLNTTALKKEQNTVEGIGPGRYYEICDGILYSNGRLLSSKEFVDNYSIYFHNKG